MAVAPLAVVPGPNRLSEESRPQLPSAIPAVPALPFAGEDEEQDPNPTKGSQSRREKKLRSEAALKEFLEKHGFTDINTPKILKRSIFPRPSCLFPAPELLYPVHVAVQEGDAEVLVALLRSGADREQKTSRGRTPLDLALATTKSSAARQSHLRIIETLEQKKILGQIISDPSSPHMSMFHLMLCQCVPFFPVFVLDLGEFEPINPSSQKVLQVGKRSVNNLLEACAVHRLCCAQMFAVNSAPVLNRSLVPTTSSF